MKKIFLGGTCGSNNWREDIVIPGLLERGVALEQIFNPVVSHWDEQAQKNEDAAKADPEYLLLFVLASPAPSVPDAATVSGYSLVEAVMSLYDSNERAVVMFDTTGLARKPAKGMKKAYQDLRVRFPTSAIFDAGEYQLMLNYLADQLTGE